MTLINVDQLFIDLIYISEATLGILLGLYIGLLGLYIGLLGFKIHLWDLKFITEQLFHHRAN